MNGLENVFDSEDLDDIFDDNEQPVEEQTKHTEPSTHSYQEDTLDLDDIFKDSDDSEEGEISAVDEFLRSKGIKDSKVPIANENNELVETNFHDLSKAEQLDVLQSLSEVSGPELYEDESEWLNDLRQNNLSVNEFLELYRNSILEEFGSKQTDSYEIDNYSDMELFLLDLKDRFDLSDEELQEELEKELKNEDLFTRKVANLRDEYKQLESQQKEIQAQEFAAAQQQEYQQFANQMVGIAEHTNEFHGLELEDDDKNETLSYMLDLGNDGKSQLARDLENPQNLYEVAWYLKYGKEAFKIIENAYESEISKLKGKQDSPRVVRTKSQERQIKNINELY